MKKLRIAFLSAGSFIHIGPYIDFFKSRGHEVILIKYDCSEKEYGVKAYDISHGASGDKIGSKWKYLLAGVSARKVLREIQPDVLHGHYVTSAGVICLMSGFRPFMLTAHGSDVIGSMKSGIWKCVLRYIFRKAVLINVVSTELAELAGQLGVPEDKLLVATLGIDTNVFRFLVRQLLQSPLRLLCTRTLGDIYDPGTIVKACSILNQRDIDFRLTLAAGGPIENELKKLTSEMGLSDKINFLGGYDNSSLPYIMNEHDIYLSASLWDGTSISLLEAMSCGLFPVVSRIKSNISWLKENQTGLMFECGNAEELAAKITQVASDKTLFKTAVETNHLVIKEKADRQKNMEILENTYYKLLPTKEPA